MIIFKNEIPRNHFLVISLKVIEIIFQASDNPDLAFS